MLFARSRALPWLQKALAAVGRTALSNYLLQTILATAIFYGHGLGLFGSVERVGQIGIVVGDLGVPTGGVTAVAALLPLRSL